MKGKLETKMARLAFGDVDPQEALRLHAEAKSDPQAARMLAEYEAMRQGLQSLREVPADQLSPDRMREAILRDGLKPKPVASSRGWGWAPVAVAALAFAFMATRHTVPTGGTEVRVGRNDVPRLMPEPHFGLVAEVQKQPHMSALVVPSVPATSPVAKLTAKRHRQHKIAPSVESAFGIDPRAILVNARAFSMDNSVVPAEIRSRASDAPAPVAVAGTIQPDNQPRTSAPIVMIDQEPDRETGAQRAIEVENSTNVVIGG